MVINRYWVKPVKKKKRYNKTYKKVLTKRRRDINSRRAVAILALWCIFATTYAFAMTSNSFNINGAVVNGTRPTNKAGALVEQASGAEKLKTPAPLPVMIETEKSNEMQIREIAKEFDFKWTDWLIRLARCENTNLDPSVKNTKGNNPSWSVDRDIFQINDYWHSEVSDECAYDLRCSTIWTIQRVNAGYQYEWVCNNKI